MYVECRFMLDLKEGLGLIVKCFGQLFGVGFVESLEILESIGHL